MKRILPVILLLACCPGCGEPDDARPLAVPQSDPEMIAAMVEAQRTLPEFFAVLDHPSDDVTGLALKLELSDANGSEFLWLHAIHHNKDGKLVGTVNNQPNVIRSVKYGATLEVDREKIRDWLYVRDDKIHGNHTVRPLLARLPPQQAEALRAKLATVAQGSGK